MTDLFTPANKKKRTRIEYIAEKITQYMTFNKINMIAVDFNDNISYKEVDVDFLIDFYDFVYRYIAYYIAPTNISPETVVNVLCLSLPRVGMPLSPLNAIMGTLENNPQKEKAESTLCTKFAKLRERLTYKNAIDAIRIYYFLYILDNVWNPETADTMHFMETEIDSLFQESIIHSPRFSYEKRIDDKNTQAENVDPNKNMLNLSREEIVKQVEEFLKKHSPHTIYNYLCEHIVGQNQAKIQISIGIYYYLKKIVTPNAVDTNNNMLMVGPSGCGKTEIIRTLQRFLPIPVIIYDVASLTSAGYKGDNKDNILRPLTRTDGIALVFLDEFDKICAPNITAAGLNFSYETQGQILSMIEGNTIPIDDGDAYINTRNTLFIAGGAYEGMEIAAKKAKMPQSTIGFSAIRQNVKTPENDRDYKVAITDVIKYGLRVELAGRFASVITLYPLTDEELHGVVKKYISYYEKMITKKIEFNKDDLNDAIKTNSLGCRHIKQIIFDMLTQALFDAPGYPDAQVVSLVKEDNKYKTIFK